MKTYHLAIALIVNAILTAAIASQASQKPQTLPWHQIALLFKSNQTFCSKPYSQNKKEMMHTKDPNQPSTQIKNYAFKLGEALEFSLPKKNHSKLILERISIGLETFNAGSWYFLRNPRIYSKDEKTFRIAGVQNQGLYRLKIIAKCKTGNLYKKTLYAIVTENWKTGILKWSRKLKEEIELSPDLELFRSSIAISHFDHAMEVSSSAAFLSKEVLDTSSQAFQSKVDFDSSLCPDFVKGLTKLTLKRFEGAEITEFEVCLPADYTDSKKWPLYVDVDPERFSLPNTRPKQSDNMIFLRCRTILKDDLHIKDYQNVLAVLRNKLNIDEKKKYLRGFCANGIPGMSLALHFPDEWAQCHIELGNSFQYLSGNALNMPLYFFSGSHPNIKRPYYNFAVKCFGFFGCEHVRTSATKTIDDIPQEVLYKTVLIKKPKRVLFTIDSPQSNKAYWVEIHGRKDENLPGTIDASVNGQTVSVNTDNVDAYSLNLEKAPLDSNEPVEIIENGTCLGPTTQSIFTKKSEKYAKAAFVKNSRIRGPVWDVFTDPYVVVYGTEIENQQFIRASQYAAEKIAKGGPCFADTDMPKELICSCNIILVGTAESNKWLAKIEHQLPVRIKNERVLAHNTSYIGQDVGFILIYPNPLNPEKYAAVFSGTSSAAILNTQKAYLHMRSIREADIGIFELTGDDGIQWHIMEKFNTVWDWHDEWDEVLAKTQKKHPKWQWQQLVAKAIKKQVGTDVVICEDPFIFPQSTPIGQITYRDLFNTFRNDWFVTISLDGESLKKLLTTPLEYTKNNKTRDVIIDGLSLTGQQEFDEDKILTINELKSDQLYTLAIRDKNLNGERLGLHFDNYDITGQTFLLPLLKEYFSSNTCTDIDARLDSLKFRIF